MHEQAGNRSCGHIERSDRCSSGTGERCRQTGGFDCHSNNTALACGHEQMRRVGSADAFHVEVQGRLRKR